MFFYLEIAMLMAGIVVVAVGRFGIGTGRALRGLPARAVGVLLMVPFPLLFAFSAGFAFVRAQGFRQSADDLEFTLTLTEFIVTGVFLLLPVLLVLAAGTPKATPGPPARPAGRRPGMPAAGRASGEEEDVLFAEDVDDAPPARRPVGAHPESETGKSALWIVLGAVAVAGVLGIVLVGAGAAWWFMSARTVQPGPAPGPGNGPAGVAPPLVMEGFPQGPADFLMHARDEAADDAHRREMVQPVRFTRWPAPPPPMDWAVPELPEGGTTLTLEGPVARVAVGGAGRYLILDVPDPDSSVKRQLAIFDACAGKIVKVLPAPVGDFQFTAGMDKLVTRTKTMLHRWSLRTFEKEFSTTAPLGPGEEQTAVAMGAASSGPVLLGVRGKLPGGQIPPTRWYFLDPETFQPLPTAAGSRQQPCTYFFEDSVARVSADGDVFRLANNLGSGENLTLVRMGLEVKPFLKTADWSVPGSFTYDRVFLAGRGAYADQVENPLASPFAETGRFPAYQGPYAVELDKRALNRPEPWRNPEQSKFSTVTLCYAGSQQPVGRLQVSEDIRMGGVQGPFIPGLHFVPGAKLLVTIHSDLSHLTLRRLDPENPPGKQKPAAPVVVSAPPVAAERGGEVDFRMETRFAGGAQKFALAAGPRGMTVSPDGRLRWKVPADWPSTETSVLVSMTDGEGRETFRRFWLIHPGDAAGNAAVTYRAGALPAPVPFPAPKFDGARFEKKFATPFRDWVVGGAGRYLVLFDVTPGKKRLSVVDLSTTAEVGDVPLPDDADPANTFFAAGNDKLLVFLPGATVVERWGLPELRREAVEALPPWGGIKAVAMGPASDGPVLVSWYEDSNQSARASFDFLDVATLQPLAVPQSGEWWTGVGTRATDEIQMRASMNGRTFGIWKLDGTPSGLQTIVLSEAGAAKCYQHETVEYATPGPDGKTVFTNIGRWAADLKPLAHAREADFCLPARQGDWFCRIAPVRQYELPAPGSRMYVYRPDRDEPILEVPDLDGGLIPADGRLTEQQPDPKRGTSAYDRRVHLFPETGVVVVLPHGNDRVVWYRVKP
jgi:hypothetical protein